MLKSGARPVTVFPEGVPFDRIMQSTPVALRSAGLFEPLAIEWCSGAHRAVSVRLVARALGARSARRNRLPRAWTVAVRRVSARLWKKSSLLTPSIELPSLRLVEESHRS